MQYSKEFDTCCVLHSNGISAACGYNRYDWLAAFGARAVLQANAPDAFEKLKQFHSEQPGWLFGFLGYDLKNETEHLASHNPDGLCFPDLFFFQPEQFIYSQNGVVGGNVELLEIIENTKVETFRQHDPVTISARISKEQYLQKAEAIKRHLAAGNVYELNLCMEFFADNAHISPEETWLRLNSLSPMPFAGFMKFEQNYLICASPERYFMKQGSRVVSQPIKGTVKRAGDTAIDEQVKHQLAHSEKERSENIMIVDLVRNDVARSSVPGSVQVDELCGIYSYTHLHQMVSTVSGVAKPDLHVTDIIRQAFPMGSMTGCPKIAAMQLIEHYEASRRGLFSGSLGYFSPNGDFDLNVVIRSILYNGTNGFLSYQAGSALTWLAQAELEYEECMLKAANMQRILAGD